MRSFQPFEFFIKCLSSLSSEIQNKKENILTFEILIPSCVVLVLAFFWHGVNFSFLPTFLIVSASSSPSTKKLNGNVKTFDKFHKN